MTSDDDLCFMPARELAAAIRTRQVSPVEVVDAHLARIHRVDPQLRGYCTLTEERARAAAREAEAALMRGGVPGPLHGVPVSVKDLLFVEGVRAMRGSAIFEDFVPAFDSPSVERLKRAGAIVLGKTSTSEFGWKGVTDSRVSGVTRNPWQLECTPGGSSGGAAATVCAGLGTLALGTDGGGSIRIPASFTGVFGLKPSFGLVPMWPPNAAAQFAHAGPITRTVRDAALMLNVIAGADDRDLGSIPGGSGDYIAACDGGISGLAIAWSPTLGDARVDPEIARVTAAALDTFADLGCRVEEVDTEFESAEAIFTTIWTASIGAFLKPYLAKWQDRMDPGLVELVKSAARLTADQFGRALLERPLRWQSFRTLFEKFDLLVTPTLPVAAFPVDAESVMGKPATSLSWTPFTYPFNLTGQPAASVPCGFTDAGLPVGLQIVGRRHADRTVLRACAAFEEARPSKGRPPI